MGSHTKRNGPDYFGYYKCSALDLFSQNEDVWSAILDLESEPSAGTYSGAEVGRFSGSAFFRDQIIEGLSDFKRERLKILLQQSVKCLNQEIDEIHGRILAMFQIEEDLKEKDLGPPPEDLEEPESRRSQNSSVPDKFGKLAEMHQSQSFRKAYEDLQVLLHNEGSEAEDAVDKCFTDALAELGQMEQNLEEYLNILASKCRQMTSAEKELLGQRIHRLPIKALDRIVEIIHYTKSSEKQLPDKVHIDLEKEDNATLWRLYFYAKTVERANSPWNTTNSCA